MTEREKNREREKRQTYFYGIYFDEWKCVEGRAKEEEQQSNKEKTEEKSCPCNDKLMIKNRTIEIFRF